MTYKIQSHIKPPKTRRAWKEPSEVESRAFNAFIAAYKDTHGCKLTFGHFDPSTRLQVFHGPAFSLVYGVSRCKALTRQLKFRKAA